MTATTAPSRSWPMIARIFVYAPAAAGTLPARNSQLHSKKSGLRVTWCPCVIHRSLGRSEMPGYSGTPLPKKLGIKPGFRLLFIDAPSDVLAELKSSTAGCDVVRSRKIQIDFAMVFAKSRSMVSTEFSRLEKQLSPAGMLWASWPKKSAGVATDLDENVVREIGLAASLVDVKVCAVTEIWSGLKFVRRLKDR